MYDRSPSLESLLVRQTAISVIFQGVLDAMISKGILKTEDVIKIRQYAMDLSHDMLKVSDVRTRAAGVRIGEEVEAFLRVVVDLPPEPMKKL